MGDHQTITLRHCYATLSTQGTDDDAATQAALGYTRLATTQRYLTATLARTAAAAQAVESAMNAHPCAHPPGYADGPNEKTQPQGWE